MRRTIIYRPAIYEPPEDYVDEDDLDMARQIMTGCLNALLLQALFLAAVFGVSSAIWAWMQ